MKKVYLDGYELCKLPAEKGCSPIRLWCPRKGGVDVCRSDCAWFDTQEPCTKKEHGVDIPGKVTCKNEPIAEIVEPPAKK